MVFRFNYNPLTNTVTESNQTTMTIYNSTSYIITLVIYNFIAFDISIGALSTNVVLKLNPWLTYLSRNLGSVTVYLNNTILSDNIIVSLPGSAYT
jgi:hypothetical protein